MWEGSISFDDPPVYVVVHGVRTPTVSEVLELSFEICALLLELESCILKLLVPRP